MNDLTAHLFDVANTANAAATQHMAIGREQMAREVKAWIVRNADPTTGMAHTETLRALCERELAK